MVPSFGSLNMWFINFTTSIHNRFIMSLVKFYCKYLTLVNCTNEIKRDDEKTIFFLVVVYTVCVQRKGDLRSFAFIPSVDDEFHPKKNSIHKQSTHSRWLWWLYILFSYNATPHIWNQKSISSSLCNTIIYLTFKYISVFFYSFLSIISILL